MSHALKWLAPLALLAALAGCASTPPPLPATYESVTWTIESQSDYPVMVRFFSQNRDVYWGEDGGDYYIDDYEEHTFSLRCRTSEKICYGAWIAGNRDSGYWGTGPYNEEGCEDCCLVCREGNETGNTLYD